MLGMSAKKGYTKSQNVIALCDIIEGSFACFEKYRNRKRSVYPKLSLDVQKQHSGGSSTLCDVTKGCFPDFLKTK